MQTLAETISTVATSVLLGASIFFSVYGRNDATKAIATLAYQLAVDNIPYHKFIEEQVRRDPSLLDKSMATQFDRFIVEPFTQLLPNSHQIQLLILLDGLDECDSHHEQCELLGLIPDFCIKYPASPLIWVVASRPEPHITSFFSRAEVTLAYKKEEILVDSDEAREDVERFLYVELKKIQMRSPTLAGLPRWPMEHDFLKVTFASDGLFAYSSTVVKFISDPAYGNPASQLREVLEVIDSNPMYLAKGKSHPMAHLDALYTRILSKIPADVMVDTRKLLLKMTDWSDTLGLMCNILAMTKDTAYGATYHLRSVLDVPEPDEAMSRELRCFHKSFIDYIKDFERSKFCSHRHGETQELHAFCARRILEEVLNGVPKDGAGAYANISLSWPSEEQGVLDDFVKLELYRYAAYETVQGLRRNRQAFWSSSFVRALSAFNENECFESLEARNDFRLLLFDKSLLSELTEYGALSQVPIRMLESQDIDMEVRVTYRLQRPAAAVAEIPDLCGSPCSHYSRPFGRDNDQDQDQDRSGYMFLGDICSCPTRFFRHLQTGKTYTPDDLVTVFTSSMAYSLVEYRFIDSRDGISEWTYIFGYRFPSHNTET